MISKALWKGRISDSSSRRLRPAGARVGAKLMFNVTLSVVVYGFLAVAVAQINIPTSRSALDSDPVIDDTNAGFLENIPKHISGISSELLPETREFAALMELQCHFGQQSSSEEKLRLTDERMGLLHDACLFPIIVRELEKRRDLILTGRYVLLPPNWNIYTLQSGGYSEVLFAPSSASTLITEYLILREALRVSVLDLKQLIVVQSPDKTLPLYALQLLRVNAAARSSLVAHRLLEVSRFLAIEDSPPYLQRWQPLLRNAAVETIAPYRSKLEEFERQLLHPKRKTVQNMRLTTIYEVSLELQALSQPEYSPVRDFLNFVFNLPCSRKEVQAILEAFAASMQLQPTFGMRNSVAIANALKCIAALRDLQDLASTTSTDSEIALSIAIESLPDLKSLVVSAQAELDTMIGSLQNYMASDTTSPF